MFILHSFVLAAILYFVMVRAGVYFERLLYVSVVACIVQAAVAGLLPMMLVQEPVGNATEETRSWMEPGSPEVEGRRRTISLVLGIIFYVVLAGFLMQWYKMDPVRAVAVAVAFAGYQFVLAFMVSQVIMMLSTTQQQKIGW